LKDPFLASSLFAACSLPVRQEPGEFDVKDVLFMAE